MELQEQWCLALIAMDRSTKPIHWTIREITTSKRERYAGDTA